MRFVLFRRNAASKRPGGRSRRAAGVAVVSLGAAGLLVVSPGPARASGTSAGGSVSLVHLAAPELASGSRLEGAAPAAEVVHVDVTLPSRDPAGLAELATAVSTPGGAEYRKFIGTGEFADRFGATSGQIAAVRLELREAGLFAGKVAANGLSIPVTATLGKVEVAFHTRVDQVRLASGRVAYARATTATLPAGADGLIGLDQAVSAHDYLDVAPRAEVSLPPQSCPAATTRSAHTPSALDSAYDLDGLYAAGLDGAGETIALFELADFSASDLDAYAQCLGLPDPDGQTVAVDGGASVGDGTTETTSDIEELMSVAPDADFIAYEGPNTESGLYDTYSAIVDQDKAQVIGTSWGVCEAENDPSLMQGENLLFQQAAVQGETFLAASGDSGSEDCYDPPYSTDESLQVDDPSSQPYVTGVGGTSLVSASPRQESAWNADGGAGGGGISTVWDMPSWQTSVAGASSSGAPCGATSGDCREVPDVSASADPDHGYVVYCTAGDCQSRGWATVGGTSLASPLWAGIVALADEACPASPRAGLLNPFLYGAGRADLNDITSGSNDLLGVNGGDYTAGPGYDMATGLGSPDATALAASLCASSAVSGASGGSGGSGTATTTTTTPGSTPTTTTPTVPSGGGSGAGSGGAGGSGSGGAHGYRFVAADGGVFDFGSDGFDGSAAGRTSGRVVGMAQVPGGGGYWVVTSVGEVLAFGDAGSYGSLRSPASAPVVGMASTADGRGYWLVTSAGQVDAFGDAAYHGSAAGIRLSAPVVGMAADWATGGYWLVASDGGVFSYGAPFYGSTGAIHLAKPIVGMSALPDGSGYRFVASDGGVFDYGRAAFYGSTGAERLAAPVVGMATTSDGHGYWLVGSDGGVFSFGDAPFLGSTGAEALAAPITGVAGG